MSAALAIDRESICPNFVNGQWVAPRSLEALERRNPADPREIVGYAALSTRAEVREAVAAAMQALPAWRAQPAPRRGRILANAARRLEDHREDLARLLTREEGKTVGESRGELARAINTLDYIAGEARRLTGETLPSELLHNFVYTFRQPLGVVGLITPWNFPVAVPVWKLAPALVCGNTVVWKPSEITPLCSRRVVEVLVEAGLPHGVLNMVNGLGEEAGDELVEHPAVEAISFTGSNAVGAIINAKAARQFKKVQLEMGGKNPAVVLEDADLELAAEHTVMGAFGSAGERCTATSRVVVVEPVADRFVELVAARASALRVGDPLDPATQVGPLVSREQFEKVLIYLELGKREARLVCGGGRAPMPDGLGGYFIQPTVFDRVLAGSRLAQEEIFGPVLAVIRVRDFEEALAVANGVRYGLTASIFTTDANRIFQAAERLECGMVHINSPTVGGEAHVPFGGIKGTGCGERESGSTAIDFYSELKVVYVDYTGQKRDGNLY
ncbi:MAG TPA: aldehyde dehydrogenase family protein [Terriglobia bacterium]|nr:aldehyde dehydrogenase family protein [Terriglobia bacterium]